MASREARLRVLKMLEEGKITREEAQALLQALSGTAAGGRASAGPRAGGTATARTAGVADLLKGLLRGWRSAPPGEVHEVSYDLSGVEHLEIRRKGGAVEVLAEPGRTTLEGTANAEEQWEVNEGRGIWTLSAVPWGAPTRARVPDHLPLSLSVEGGALAVRRHRAALTVDLRGGKGVVEDHSGPLTLRVRGGALEASQQGGPVKAEVQGGKLVLKLVEPAPADLEVQGGVIHLKVPADAAFRVEPVLQGGVVRFDQNLRARVRRENDAYVVGEAPTTVFRLRVQGGKVEIKEL